ncbi:MAG: fatty-acid oxidation protein subunit alpha, partial [Chlamydiia bacterium]|nr:fatty-acid oxidation protein subunit alpha [Chlamydiia bacterium]
EIIPGRDTSPETVNAAVALVQGLGKTPVVVQDCAGFLVNRILFPYLNEALHLLNEGMDFEYVDKCITNFGMPMGPFTLDDEVGLDTAYKAAKSVEHVYGARMQTLPFIGKLVEAGLLGKKSGKGFYIHEKGKKRVRNSDIEKIVGLGSKAMTKPDAQLIVDRLILPMVNEAVRCLEDKIIEKPEYLDMAMILGTGFPPFRGGLLRYADSRGLANVVGRLEELAQQYGERYRPAEMLREFASKQMTFYQN